jgi:hypothetical protein
VALLPLVMLGYDGAAMWNMGMRWAANVWIGSSSTRNREDAGNAEFRDLLTILLQNGDLLRIWLVGRFLDLFSS